MVTVAVRVARRHRVAHRHRPRRQTTHPIVRIARLIVVHRVAAPTLVRVMEQS